MFTRLSANFASLLAPHFCLEDLEDSHASVFGRWPDFTLTYFNPVWVGLARANSGQPQIASKWEWARVI